LLLDLLSHIEEQSKLIQSSYINLMGAMN